MTSPSLPKRITIEVAKSVSNVLGRRIFAHAIVFLARLGQIDLLTLAYQKIGILNSENDVVSGEHFVISSFLKKMLSKDRPVFFDVGANRGFYAEALTKYFPQAMIFAFEPNADAYALMKGRLSLSNVQMFRMGFDTERSKKTIYAYTDEPASSHSSVFKEVFTVLHPKTEIRGTEFECTTIDDFCAEHGIDFIDFMKIDTEGSEYNILRGAQKMLTSNKIRFVQFEFNEMNIISRVFLRDFYNLLKQYTFYRLSENRLIPLGGYDPKNEIFRFQNILAVNSTLPN